jgi:hypothetical protein
VLEGSRIVCLPITPLSPQGKKNCAPQSEHGKYECQRVTEQGLRAGLAYLHQGARNDNSNGNKPSDPGPAFATGWLGTLQVHCDPVRCTTRWREKGKEHEHNDGHKRTLPNSSRSVVLVAETL